MIIQEDGSCIIDNKPSINGPRYKSRSCDRFIQQYKQYDILFCDINKIYFATITDYENILSRQKLEELINALDSL